MNNLYEPSRVHEIQDRLARLKPAHRPLWGTMDAAQAIAHCALSMEWAVGDSRPPRMFVGRILGTFVKSKALGKETPMHKNSPTAKTLVIAGERDLDQERIRLSALIERFAAAGPAGCTNHPHSFFGRLTPEQWAELMYKHLDHHLRQFGV